VSRQKLPRTVFRLLDGILLLDKPAGLSSNQALQRVRHLFRAEKAGHTGSLDPLATGLLPICFGEATKIAGHLLGNSKAYETVAKLGVTTDTDDADGQVLRERSVPVLTVSEIEQAIQPLIGRISQRPPIYSALKQGGEPLYVKARRGESIDIPAREVDVQAIEILDLRGHEIFLRVTCGSGTYVRSLVRDLGEALGCGAHVAALRRLWVDPFREPHMYTLEQLLDLAGQGEPALDACLLPVEAGLVAWPVISLNDEQAKRLGQGQGVSVPEEVASGDVLVTDLTGRPLGLGTMDGAGNLRASRLFRWAGQC
jgi:tRNA pseudouridine55 synthase